MSYFPDLTPYSYFARWEPDDVRTLNVGWLGQDHQYEKGQTPDEFKNRLFSYCLDQNVVLLARGFHECEFCNFSPQEWFERCNDRYGPGRHWMSIGVGEIRIPAPNWVFAAPMLINHYVIDHSYRPPESFIEAVLAAPDPSSAEYQTFLSKWRRFRTPLGVACL